MDENNNKNDDNIINNDDRLINSDKDEADQLMDETLVFRRDPSVKDEQNTNRNPASGRPNPARPMNIPSEMQNTAKLQGGAVIRPLKPVQQSSNRPQTDRSGNGNRSTGQQGVRPTQTAGSQPNRTPSGSQNSDRTAGFRMNKSGQASAPRPNPSATPERVNTPRPAVATDTPNRGQRPAGATPAGATPAGATANPASNAAGQASQRPVQGNISPVTPPNKPPAGTNPSQVPPTGTPSSLPVVRAPAAAQRRSEFKDFEIDEATWRRAPEPPQTPKYSARESATGALMSVIKAVVYIVCVIAISIPLSIFVINTANDVFAFVKDEKVISVTIPDYATIDEIGDILGKAGVIKYPWAFKLWSKLKIKDQTPEFVAGTYEVSTTVNYDNLRLTFTKRNIRSTVRITIPEGYTVDEIIELFVSNGIGTKEGFVDAINNYAFDYRFLEDLVVTNGRYYRLEGYLFPDTYEFYTDSTEVVALTKLLDNFDRKFIDEYYLRCQDIGLTVDQAITLASMVEKEAKYADEFGNVASVFSNRLKYSSSYPKLESDATIMYAIQHDTGSRKDTMTGTDTDYETPYNTYKYKGLPPGPIANPGINAIKYALYPNDTNYFYFVADISGHSLFATTYDEHLKNIKIARGN